MEKRAKERHKSQLKQLQLHVSPSRGNDTSSRVGILTKKSVIDNGGNVVKKKRASERASCRAAEKALDFTAAGKFSTN